MLLAVSGPCAFLQCSSSVVAKNGRNSPPPLPVKSMTMSGPATGRGRPPRRKTTEVTMSHLEEEVNTYFFVSVFARF